MSGPRQQFRNARPDRACSSGARAPDTSARGAGLSSSLTWPRVSFRIPLRGGGHRRVSLLDLAPVRLSARRGLSCGGS